ncbi:hypothetical protein SAMN02745121_03137 [Nannocystis exedens]|uniref:Uncharacterized protein n=1 Tax=Nannocystis exedens TaxID=54 RepID=A0A1I1Y511_9BACT|nr:hypothetical protein [Nannocystis exedens]PCC71785.1 hypothetical protein NAEX_04864 [Nannocystis exedens]SFE14068.1 hypothetical protein SAMN02745121_03137 [Nannocystis exedens]
MFLRIENQNHLGKNRRVAGEAATQSGARWERWFVLSVAGLLLVVPPIVRELYPFSLPSMFSRAIDRLAVYKARDPRGAPVPLERLRLHVPEWHDPPVRTLGRAGYGRRKPASAHVLGEVASAAEVERAVRWALRRDPSLPPAVTVTQTVLGRGEHGALAVLSRAEWTIAR